MAAVRDALTGRRRFIGLGAARGGRFATRGLALVPHRAAGDMTCLPLARLVPTGFGPDAAESVRRGPTLSGRSRTKGPAAVSMPPPRSELMEVRLRSILFVQRAGIGRTVRAALVAAGAALVGGCTVTPWTDSWQPTHVPSQPAPRASSGVPAGYYRVNSGDTLASIASAFGQRTLDIASWNHMAPTDMVMPGQVLRVAPPPSTATFAPPPAAEPQPEAAASALAWPAHGTVTTPFGAGRNHGIVITSTGGDRTVRAAAPGRVVYAGTGVAAYGPLVILKHENGLITAYGHNEKLLVNEGDAVSAGQPVAEMATDASGRSTFEFEVRRNGKAVDPLGLLPRNGS